MVSFFYPTSFHGVSSYPLAADFPPKTAAYIDESVGVPPGIAESVFTQSHALAPISDPSKFPILLFSPGQGSSRLTYTATVEDIASLGYVVVSVDHPNDTSFIEYPDGRVATHTNPPPTPSSFVDLIPDVDARVSDLRYVLDSFSNETFISQVPGVGGHGKSNWNWNGGRKGRGSCFNIDKVGAFGHSLGGATAASTILADKRFVAGIDLDGAIIGNATTLGLSAPFLLMSSAVHNRTNDPTWATFWDNLRGYKRELAIAGTLHLSYSDYLPLADVAVAAGLLTKNATEALVGTIDGSRMLTIESAYIGSFFDMWLKGGKGELLNGPSKFFPEVSFDD